MALDELIQLNAIKWWYHAASHWWIVLKPPKLETARQHRLPGLDAAANYCWSLLTNNWLDELPVEKSQKQFSMLSKSRQPIWRWIQREKLGRRGLGCQQRGLVILSISINWILVGSLKRRPLTRLETEKSVNIFPEFWQRTKSIQLKSRLNVSCFSPDTRLLCPGSVFKCACCVEHRSAAPCDYYVGCWSFSGHHGIEMKEPPKPRLASLICPLSACELRTMSISPNDGRLLRPRFLSFSSN